MDTYQIRAGWLGPQHAIDISAEDYAAHVRARHCLIDAGSFERRYELLLGNFMAWEEFCAVSQLRFEIDHAIGYEEGDRLIMDANRHALNVFSSGKTYVDQVGRDFDILGPDLGFSAHAKRLIGDAHDRSLEYRLTYQLRNHTQHRALPIDGCDAGTKSGDKESISFYCSKAKIVEDIGNFKKSVLDEAPDKIDLRKILRGYITQLSGVHIALRAKVRPDVDSSRALFVQSIKTHASAQSDPKKLPKGGVGIEAVHLRDGTQVEAVPLLLKWDDTRKRLAEKNRYPIK
ncbi:hypothetical protein [Pseudoxanthomonas winnipegensis]|uniref:hypothetical protein n=1 Tax=Pseudoxanthomonas winnipegensis TaxID=2480810 RepID=UPI00104017B3|nr:hypothetical protein [Pseudoxanthomonas winnipegensis]TBV69759.1 hypothetical protein EYC45_19110 [Pseudoxanthomonas winnipegensis]